MTLFRSITKGLAVLAVSVTASGATEFPDRNIENIYPWGPGTTMAISQIIADAMGNELDVSIPVVSTPGASGVKAFKTALEKPADGYTIFDGYVAPLVLAPLLGNADWSYKDFTPLYSATSNSFAIIVRPDDNRFPDLPALFDYMRANPGKARYSTGAVNNLPHMVLAKVLQTADVYGTVIPFDESEQAMKDLRGGVFDFIITNPGTYKANKDNVRVLAVLSELEEVVAIYDGAPRVQDYGYDLGMSGLSPMGWNWWLVRKDTPADVVETLRTAMAAALARDDVQEKLLNLGYVPTNYGPDQYDEIVGAVGAELQSGIDAIEWVMSKQ
ncbi:Bug family tripartite tricarboxylate transporter substrate binding protein [Candidatus Halocynthiibacter alkanivorans]|jgi:putative tricarboxylic transport membrane protein|uniref:Bug family tripartite tricarboxylate transporter substrate binding protein n=1 Tax=Candidatus Halocynthiibacter alkanivorans TaxID=2267619 RepID=UPI000DF432F4|nr:tripartite tricarboxylate transporter substrate binding protein [Candidatus Halocynthiibacter alkanivorans]